MRALNREELCLDPLRLVLPRNYPLASDAQSVALSALADRSWAIGPVGPSDGDFVVRMCHDLGGFDPIIRHRASNLLIILGLIRVGRAVSISPDMLGRRQRCRGCRRPDRSASSPPNHLHGGQTGVGAPPKLSALREALRRALVSSPRVLHQHYPRRFITSAYRCEEAIAGNGEAMRAKGSLYGDVAVRRRPLDQPHARCHREQGNLHGRHRC
jgi:hypothetical protein